MKLEACVTKQEHFLRGAAFSPNYHDFWQGTVVEATPNVLVFCINSLFKFGSVGLTFPLFLYIFPSATYLMQAMLDPKTILGTVY